MSAPAPVACAYVHGGMAEPMLRWDATGGPHALILPPLFAEMNRCRRLLVDVMAALARHGIASWLPDLPGTAESLRDLAEIGWEDWRVAAAAAGAVVAEASGAAPMTLALRGGALFDDAVAARARWRVAPVGGAALLRDLTRARLAADRESGAAGGFEAGIGVRPTLLAGHVLSASLASGLRAAEPRGDARTLALGEGEGMLAGPPLWRRAEPGRSLALAAAIADDFARWALTCAAS